MSDIVIGIDAGTSVIKSVAFDLDGRQIAVASQPNRYETLQGGGAEQDLARTWADTASTLRQLADLVPDLAARTVALAVTGQGDGTWLIDRDGEPVGHGWLWLDARSADIVDEIRARPDDRDRYAITGTGLAACQQGPQLVWMERNAPEALARAATAFHCKDWLYYKLAGARVTDTSEGTFTFGDFRTRAYDERVVAALGLERQRHLLPEIVDGTQRQDPLTREAAGLIGLREGTPVVLGYVDVICSALGGGLYDRSGDLGCTIIGSTGMHMRLVPDVADVHLNEHATGYTMPMPIPGVVAQMQSNMAATLNIDWVLGLASGILASQGIERKPAEMIALIDQWIAASEPAAILYQPYVSEAGERGPFVDAHARAGFVGISSRHGFGDLVRAVFDGLGFAARDCYTAMGGVPGEVRLSGGAARSVALRRILAAALGARVRTSQREEAGAAGAAMMAMVSLGHFATMDDCVARWVTPLLNPAEEADAALAAIYSRTYPAYATARTVLKPVWRDMTMSRMT